MADRRSPANTAPGAELRERARLISDLRAQLTEAMFGSATGQGQALSRATEDDIRQRAANAGVTFQPGQSILTSLIESERDIYSQLERIFSAGQQVTQAEAPPARDEALGLRTGARPVRTSVQGYAQEAVPAAGFVAGALGQPATDPITGQVQTRRSAEPTQIIPTATFTGISVASAKYEMEARAAGVSDTAINSVLQQYRDIGTARYLGHIDDAGVLDAMDTLENLGSFDEQGNPVLPAARDRIGQTISTREGLRTAQATADTAVSGATSARVAADAAPELTRLDIESGRQSIATSQAGEEAQRLAIQQAKDAADLERRMKVPTAVESWYSQRDVNHYAKATTPRDYAQIAQNVISNYNQADAQHKTGFTPDDVVATTMNLIGRQLDTRTRQWLDGAIRVELGQSSGPGVMQPSPTQAPAPRRSVGPVPAMGQVQGSPGIDAYLASRGIVPSQAGV